jgi:alkyl sulfatase BDS1-like metallo-beta-lactamase superfamily hydrolase
MELVRFAGKKASLLRSAMLLSTVVFALSPTGLSASEGAEGGPYMGQPTETAIVNGGARINSDYLKGSLGEQDARIIAVEPGIWAIVGRAIVNVYVIEGKQGLVVYDTGFSEAEGKAILADIRTFSDRPVSAIIYSHTHYPYGAGVLAEGRDIPVIGHSAVDQKATASGLGGSFPETMPVQMARANEQMGTDLPMTGPDSAIGHVFQDPWGKKAFLPVNRVPKDGEEITLDGIRFQFFTANVADSESVTAWMPERGVILNNFYWPTAANLFAPRGDEFRDARSWIRGLKIIRDLEPQILLSTHAMPIKGKDWIQAQLEKFIDFHSMIIDQSLRGILKGLSADELRYFVHVPPSLQGITQNYGESLTWYPPSVYNEAMGWFSGDAADLNPPPADFVNKRLVSMLGGSRRIIHAIDEAESRKEWAWALQLANYLYKSDPSNSDFRQRKAGLLRKHAELTSSSIAHNFYISQALNLEGRISLGQRSYPMALLQKMPACALMESYRIRIVPEWTEGLRGTLFFKTPEESCALEIRPGVAEYVADPGPGSGFIVHTTKDRIVSLYRGEISMGELINSAAMGEQGDKPKALSLAAAFEVLPGK